MGKLFSSEWEASLNWFYGCGKIQDLANRFPPDSVLSPAVSSSPRFPRLRQIRAADSNGALSCGAALVAAPGKRQ